MKKTALAIVIILSLLASMLSGIMLDYFVCANPFPTDPVISMEAPVNKTYDVNSLVLNITIVTRYDGYYFNSTRRVSYSLDGDTNVAVAEIDYSFDEEEKASTFFGSAVLSELADGPHSLTVFAEYDYDVKIIQSQKSISFTIDTRPDSSVDPETNSQSYSTITINPNGSVEGTDKIQRDGNIYSFTGNIVNQSIVVEKDDIVIDGAYCLLRGNGTGAGISLESQGRVTIKNLHIRDFIAGVGFLEAHNNTVVGNLIEYCDVAVSLTDSESNSITGNTLMDNDQGFYFFTCYGNEIWNNSLINNVKQVFDNYFNNPGLPSEIVSVNVWDNGEIGNYWSDYDGTDDNGDSIGDTSYFIDENNQDNFPLLNPVAIASHLLTPYPKESPPPLPSLEPTSSPEPQPEPFPTVPVVAFLASAIVVVVGLAICFRKRRSEAKSP